MSCFFCYKKNFFVNKKKRNIVLLFFFLSLTNYLHDKHCSTIFLCIPVCHLEGAINVNLMVSKSQFCFFLPIRSAVYILCFCSDKKLQDKKKKQQIISDRNILPCSRYVYMCDIQRSNDVYRSFSLSVEIFCLSVPLALLFISFCSLFVLTSLMLIYF
jgi:hypothetical protein